jgi:hypothetical protein
VASVFIVESELPVPLGAAASLPLAGLRVVAEPLLSVVLDEPIDGLGDGDALVLGDVVVPELLGGVVVVESGGMVVAFDDD